MSPALPLRLLPPLFEALAPPLFPVLLGAGSGLLRQGLALLGERDLSLRRGPRCFSSRAAWRWRRFGFLAIARASQATAGPRESLAHSLSTKSRTSSFEGSAPKTTRHELSALSLTRSTIPTQNWPSKHTTRAEDTDAFRTANSSFM